MTAKNVIPPCFRKITAKAESDNVDDESLNYNLILGRSDPIYFGRYQAPGISVGRSNPDAFTGLFKLVLFSPIYAENHDGDVPMFLLTLIKL